MGRVSNCIFAFDIDRADVLRSKLDESEILSQAQIEMYMSDSSFLCGPGVLQVLREKVKFASF